jgi:SSS family solute:Na+ symporter
MGKRYGFVTPGEMYSTYFGSEAMRILTVIVALFFSIPYLGIQLRASGILFNILTDGLFSVNVGMWMLAIIVTLYVAWAVCARWLTWTRPSASCCGAGIVALGVIGVNFAGGWDGMTIEVWRHRHLDQQRRCGGTQMGRSGGG